jgi:hypothetical protein
MATSTPEPAPAPGTPPGINREAQRSVLSVIPEQNSESYIAPIIPPVAGHRTELPVVHEEYLPRHSLRTTSGDAVAMPGSLASTTRTRSKVCSGTPGSMWLPRFSVCWFQGPSGSSLGLFCRRCFPCIAASRPVLGGSSTADHTASS